MPDPVHWGPDNPHPLSQMRTELVWDGKYDEYGRRRSVDVAGAACPMQKIETVDMPRSEALASGQTTLGELSTTVQEDFRNRLIWGDNKLVMASLLKEFRGKIDMIYIDPPFDVGADFTMQVPISEEKDAVQKDQSLLEMVAYRDMWGKGSDSYLNMLFERLSLMKELLSEKGSLYVHVGQEVSQSVRLIGEDIFGKENFVNEIVWRRGYSHNDSKQGSEHFGRIHETIFYFRKSEGATFNQQYNPYSQDYIDTYYKFIENGTGRRYWLDNLQGPGGAAKGNPQYEVMGVTRYWRYSKERMARLIEEGRVVQTKPGTVPKYKRYLDEMPGKPIQDFWDDVQSLAGLGAKDSERAFYPTQKPETLLERIIQTSSNEGDLVADFFCGSGTTGAVAERLGRRWIMCDLGRFAIHTSRKRLIELQRKLQADGKPYRAFDVYNLGRYERQWWQLDRLKGADSEHRRLVLQFYQAAPLDNPPHPLLHGKKHGAFVHVDQIDSIFAFDELKAAAEAARSAGGRELHCLAWEFEMELAAKKQAIEAETGLTVRLKYIPREIMEPNRTACQFFEAGYLEARAIKKGKKVDVELLRFTPALAEAPEAEMSALRERAIKSPFDFIDFWAVDFDWRDNKPFEHHWQDFRTRKDRSLKTRTDLGWEYDHQGPHRVCIKVIDVFGVDTTTIIAA